MEKYKETWSFKLWRYKFLECFRLLLFLETLIVSRIDFFCYSNYLGDLVFIPSYLQQPIKAPKFCITDTRWELERKRRRYGTGRDGTGWQRLLLNKCLFGILSCHRIYWSPLNHTAIQAATRFFTFPFFTFIARSFASQPQPPKQKTLLLSFTKAMSCGKKSAQASTRVSRIYSRGWWTACLIVCHLKETTKKTTSAAICQQFEFESFLLLNWHHM